MSAVSSEVAQRVWIIMCQMKQDAKGFIIMTVAQECCLKLTCIDDLFYRGKTTVMHDR